jgi:hypothetical protein
MRCRFEAEVGWRCAGQFDAAGRRTLAAGGGMTRISLLLTALLLVVAARSTEYWTIGTASIRERSAADRTPDGAAPAG